MSLYLAQRQALTRGEVIAYPTEAVWGFGCAPDSELGLQRLLQLKQRDWHKGLLLVAASVEQLQPYIDFDPEQIAQLKQHWPASISYVFRHNRQVSELVSGGRDTIVVRVSQHPVVKSFCQHYGAVVSTSANVAGQAPLKSQFTIMRQFGFSAKQIIPGALGGATSVSQIIDWQSGERLR